MATAKIEPQLATLVDRPPAGMQWVHEIKFDGYRLLCQRNADRAQIFTRNGNDWTARFPSLVTAMGKLKAKSLQGGLEALLYAGQLPDNRSVAQMCVALARPRLLVGQRQRV